MKNSIGSLAALTATLAAAPAALQAAPSRDVQAAAFSNASIPLPTDGSESLYLDIDGDETNDFRIFANSHAPAFTIYGLGATLISETALIDGASFSSSSANEESVSFTPNTSAYYGFSFVTGGETHVAWVYFTHTDTAFTAVGGGWETESYYQSITVGDPAISPVPEPSAASLLAGAAALTGAFGLRRRRRE